jgi:hypothetical protein
MASRTSTNRPLPPTGYEGIPITILTGLFDKAREELRRAQSRADLIRRELRRRKHKNTK